MLRSRCHPISTGLHSIWRRTASRPLANWTLYERKTPVEHVLLRPGMYVGSTDWTKSEQWIYDSNHQTMQKSSAYMAPALLKIFDEILVNAADNFHRHRDMTALDISVEYSKPSNKIEHSDLIESYRLNVCVKNNGSSIPVMMHAEEGIYIPELIFGHLLTGSNFNDNVSRLTGGSHGYGAKLTNIFSSNFMVEIQDGRNQKRYLQQWRDHMQHCDQAVVETCKDSQSYTKITFQPDLTLFTSKDTTEGISDSVLVEDVIKMFKRRAHDVAASLGESVRVSFNGQDIACRSLQEYARLFSPRLQARDDSNLCSYMQFNDRWEVAMIASPSAAFESMSFVNSVWTPRGGTHLQAIANQIVKYIESQLNKKGLNPTSTMIRNHMMLFVGAKIENPTFEGQTKDALLTSPSQFGSNYSIHKRKLKEFIDQSDIVERISKELEMMEKAKLFALTGNDKKSAAKKKQLLDIPKLEDAHFAGTEKALDCTLILTEGDSAKALAVAGMTIVGREHFGVLPLRGKLLNVKAASKQQISQNIELMNLCKAIGLDLKKSYADGLDGQGLRYGKVMLMCDQDHDGAHIKGLLINFFQHFWPQLLSKPYGFIQEFNTPLVKVKISKDEMKSFYSSREYEEWKAEQSEHLLRKCQVKYYKGLGTSTAIEGQEYFRNIEFHRKTFQMNVLQDEIGIDKDDFEWIDLAFEKNRAADRKQWLQSFDASVTTSTPASSSSKSYKDFIQHELIHFSFSDNLRSIPNVIDGLKPSQRKVLFGTLQRSGGSNMQESKVVQLAGFIAERTAYHHGEAALHSTIVHMAQNFVGANNIPLLTGVGQFGTRAKGGIDFASPRYIFTKLSPVTRWLFRKEDDALLQYLEEDGVSVEPKYFLPVIPFLLVNGSNGIGTGWSTNIPAFHPLQIINSIESRLDGNKSGESLLPWYRNFRGEIYSTTDASLVSRGIAKRINKTTIEITELPIEKWTEDYKEYLYKLVEQGVIKSVREYHSVDEVKFVITSSKALFDEMEAKGLIEQLKLQNNISLSNMHAFDRNDKIHLYHRAEDIIDEHYDIRLNGYVTRRKQLLADLMSKENTLRNKCRFIEEILSNKLPILQLSQTEDNLADTLRNQGYDLQTEAAPAAPYSYLLNMPIHTLTSTQLHSLQQHLHEAETSRLALEKKSEIDLWKDDLKDLKAAITKEWTLQ